MKGEVGRARWFGAESTKVEARGSSCSRLVQVASINSSQKSCKGSVNARCLVHDGQASQWNRWETKIDNTTSKELKLVQLCARRTRRSRRRGKTSSVWGHSLPDGFIALAMAQNVPELLRNSPVTVIDHAG